jgi:hypothetical protein
MKFSLGNMVSGILIFALAAVLNYFGSNPRILYLPGAAFCLWIMYNLHIFVVSQEQKVETDKQRSEQHRQHAESSLADIQKNTQTANLLTPGAAEMPKIKAEPLPAAILDSMPPSIREELRNFQSQSPRWPSRQIPDSALVIFLGNSISWTQSFPHTVLRHGNDNIIAIGKEGENIWVTAQLFSEDGKVICQIVKNQFHLNRNNLFRIERPSPHRLVVINDKLQTALDVEYINKRSVRFLGDFYSMHGAHIIITAQWQSLGSGRMSACISGDNRGASYAIQ